MQEVKKIFIWIDQWLNYFSGGNRANTISGRTGYYANKAIKTTRWFWWVLQFVIDVTFYPLDGHNHCRDTWLCDESKGDYLPTKMVWSFFLLNLFVVSSCLVLVVPFYFLYFIGVFNKKNI